MRANRALPILAALSLALVLAPAAVLACDKEHKGATAAMTASADTQPCCASHGGCAKSAAHAAMLAQKAEAGDAQALTDLIATAKNMGCPRASSLATRAESGDEEARTTLIAMAQTMGSGKGTGQPTAAQLARWAEQGCTKSREALIAMMKKSEDAKTAELATRAEGGCSHSAAQLIAQAQADAPAGPHN
jgi:hypothetical protein